MDSYPYQRRHTPYWAIKYIRRLARSAIANEIGADGFGLLCVVASQEDAKFYKGAVTYFNAQLMPLCGFASWRRLEKARQAVIAAGLLHYEPVRDGTRKAGKYWVLDGPLEGLPDHGCDESPHPIAEAYAAGYRDGKAGRPYAASTHRPSAESTQGYPGRSADSAEGSTEGPTQGPTDLSYPNPSPTPSSSQAEAEEDGSAERAAASDGRQAVSEFLRLGVGRARSLVVEALARGCTERHLVAICRWFERSQARQPDRWEKPASVLMARLEAAQPEVPSWRGWIAGRPPPPTRQEQRRAERRRSEQQAHRERRAADRQDYYRRRREVGEQVADGGSAAEMFRARLAAGTNGQPPAKRLA